ncbi:hypothetical protein [Arthrobacter roseus]|uniref:hypothetical protein n=1 Tax=Arthrobacter roseus TaxID=136274 RepID=UPI001964EC4F|nr:hypothetical protein [Arthrobacter roseus]MBM7847507.1 hypothetical protein [Arthrobacter roseus]
MTEKERDNLSNLYLSAIYLYRRAVAEPRLWPNALAADKSFKDALDAIQATPIRPTRWAITRRIYDALTQQLQPGRHYKFGVKK